MCALNQFPWSHFQVQVSLIMDLNRYMTLTMLCSMLVVNVISFKMHDFDDSTSMIFIKTHQISIPTAYKTIEIKLEMGHFLHESNILRSIVSNISKLCHTIYCNYFHRFILQNIEQFEQNQRKLMNTKRTKRATSLLSSIYGFIFGESIEVDEETLNRLHTVHVSSKNVTSEHLRISNDTLHIQKGILNDFTDTMKVLNDRLIRAEVDLKRFNVESSMNNLIQMLIMAIDKRNGIINVILDILNGKTAQILDIIGYEHIDTYFNEINMTLHENEHFFGENALEIIESADISTQLRENAVFINIQIPIGFIDDYLSYQIISIPFIQGESMNRIKSPGFQIIYSKHADDMFTITETHLNHCKKIHRNRLICTPEMLLRQPFACEIAIFSNKKPHFCDIERITTTMPHIIRISLDTFYCVTRHVNNLTITCNDVITMHRIQRSAWFQLDAGCSVNLAGVVYHVPYVEHSKNVEIIISSVGMPNVNEVLDENGDRSQHSDRTGMLSIIIDTDMLNAQFHNLTSRLSYLYERTSEQINGIQITERWYHGRMIWLFIPIVCLIGIASRVLKCLGVWRCLTGCKG